MLKFSKKVEYALISMLYMANRQDGQLTSARELSEKFNLPQEIAGKVLQKLARHNCISSVQGVKGGYQLIQPPEEINLTTVIKAVDGPVRLVNCVTDKDNCGCDQFAFCNMRNPMELLQSRLVQFFDAITLADLQAEQSSLDARTAETINVALNI